MVANIDKLALFVSIDHRQMDKSQHPLETSIKTLEELSDRRSRSWDRVYLLIARRVRVRVGVNDNVSVQDIEEFINDVAQ